MVVNLLLIILSKIITIGLLSKKQNDLNFAFYEIKITIYNICFVSGLYE